MFVFINIKAYHMLCIQIMYECLFYDLSSYKFPFCGSSKWFISYRHLNTGFALPPCCLEKDACFRKIYYHSNFKTVLSDAPVTITCSDRSAVHIILLIEIKITKTGLSLTAWYSYHFS
jgi:hypothetical protein